MSAREPTAPEESENRSWLSVHSLLTDDSNAFVAVAGLPLVRESITAGRCDLGPGTLRNALKRLSVYDLETGSDLSALRVFDAGDLPMEALAPEEAFDPVVKSVRALCANHALTILIGGNNAITRPGVHGVHANMKQVGLLTLDAHFDLRDTDGGLNNGNPIRALLEDGFPGSHISQVGLAPFANTKKAHEKAKASGISARTLGECFEQGFVAVVREELDKLAHKCNHIYVDFDIDVIERAQMPAAPGARPGGISVRDFFAAARVVAAHPKVRCVDLSEFDPSTDVNAVGALVAGRWFAEILAGFVARPR